MTNTKFTIGDRVLVSEKSHYSPGQTGTVIVPAMTFAGIPYLGVQFASPQKSETGFPAHDCDGAGEPGQCWWIRPEHLALVEQAGAVVAPKPSRKGRNVGVKEGSKTWRVLTFLTSGKTLTAGEAIILFSLFRLASVIHNLRRAGHNISMAEKADVNGTTYAEYKLVSKRRPVAP